ncbi:MAG: glycosyltransferase family 39 protein [Nitrospinae bacterium]|nr:glycosyltransferase family 39 protein [Nitrospinota bacterium]
MAVIVLAGATLRFFLISVHDLNADEISRLKVAGQSMATILREPFEGDAPEPNPPLFTLLLHFASDNERSAARTRMVSFIASLLAVIPIYFAGKKLFDPLTGLLSAFFLTFSPWFTHYSLEAKQYTLTALCGLLVFMAFLKCGEEMSRRHMAGYFFSAQALLWTHYTGLFLLGTFFILYLIRPNRETGSWLTLHGFIALAYGPFLLAIFKILIAGSTRIDWIDPFSFDEIPRLFLIHFLGLDYIKKDPASAIYYFRMGSLWAFRIATTVLILNVFTTAFRVFKKSGAHLVTLPDFITLVYLAGPLLCFVGFSLLIRPIYQAEYQVLIYPAFVILLARSVMLVESRNMRWPYLVFTVGLWGWSFNQY